MNEKPAILEKINVRGKKVWREDAWGMFDVESIDEDGNTRYIQDFDLKASRLSAYNDHLQKMIRLDRELLRRILKDPMKTIELWGYQGRSEQKKKFYFLIWQFRYDLAQRTNLHVYVDGGVVIKKNVDIDDHGV